jgi:hypothetical protein
MVKCYLVRSRTVLERPLLAPGQQNHYVIFDASSGEIHPKITNVLADPAKSSYLDIRHPIPADTRHLVYFETILGRQSNIKHQMTKLNLSPEMQQKVDTAYLQHFGVSLNEAEPETVNLTHGEIPLASDAPIGSAGHFRERHRPAQGADASQLPSRPSRTL